MLTVCYCKTSFCSLSLWFVSYFIKRWFIKKSKNFVASIMLSRKWHGRSMHPLRLIYFSFISACRQRNWMMTIYFNVLNSTCGYWILRVHSFPIYLSHLYDYFLSNDDQTNYEHESLYIGEQIFINAPIIINLKKMKKL